MIDLTGKRFDYLEVIGIYDKDKSGTIRWKCRCKCGNIVPVYKGNLMRDNGTIKSCGCAYIEELKKEIGRRKDHLEIIGVKQYGRKGRVVVMCDCGNIKEMVLSQFENPSVHSCGCVGAKKGEDSPNFKHGMVGTRIYNVYHNMYSRCYEPNDISYTNYGAKGTTICPEWLGDNGIKNFSEWAYANGYDENAERGECTIDRIKVYKGYSPDNCRIVSMQVQQNNKRNNRYYEIDGVTKTLSEWCREHRITCVQTVHGRLKRGMDIKSALTKPIQKKVSEMTQEELEERKQHRLEMNRKWRAEHKEQIQESRDKWKRNNPGKDKESKRKYEEKKKLEKKAD